MHKTHNAQPRNDDSSLSSGFIHSLLSSSRFTPSIEIVSIVQSQSSSSLHCSHTNCLCCENGTLKGRIGEIKDQSANWRIHNGRQLQFDKEEYPNQHRVQKWDSEEVQYWDDLDHRRRRDDLHLYRTMKAHSYQSKLHRREPTMRWRYIRECIGYCRGWRMRLFIPHALFSLWPVREYDEWRDAFLITKGLHCSLSQLFRESCEDHHSLSSMTRR